MTGPLPAHLVLYDGVCALCNGSVRALLRVDRARLLHYASLQGETAGALIEQGMAIPTDASTVVYVQGGAVHLRSRAVFAIASILPYPWRMLSWLGWLPSWLTDLPYWCIARWRYRLFGEHRVCPVPPAPHRDRFLP